MLGESSIFTLSGKVPHCQAKCQNVTLCGNLNMNMHIDRSTLFTETQQMF